MNPSLAVYKVALPEQNPARWSQASSPPSFVVPSAGILSANSFVLNLPECLVGCIQSPYSSLWAPPLSSIQELNPTQQTAATVSSWVKWLIVGPISPSSCLPFFLLSFLWRFLASEGAYRIVPIRGKHLTVNYSWHVVSNGLLHSLPGLLFLKNKS